MPHYHFNAGQTALHKVVLEEGVENPLDKLIILLLNGMSVDVVDGNGDSTLHCLARLPAKKGVRTKEFQSSLLWSILVPDIRIATVITYCLYSPLFNLELYFFLFKFLSLLSNATRINPMLSQMIIRWCEGT